MGRVLLAALSDADLDSYFAVARLEEFTRRTVTDKHELRERIEKVRAREYCIVDQELEPDLISIALPVFNASGRVVAALNVSAQASRTTNRRAPAEAKSAAERSHRTTSPNDAR